MQGRRVGLSLQEKEPNPSISGPEVGPEPGQAVPHLGRQANSELLVGRSRAAEKTLAAGLSFQESMPVGQGV